MGNDSALQWRYNRCDGVSNHQPRDCLLSRLIRRWSKKTSKLRVTGFCARNSPEPGEFPAQMASNAENFSIWWRHHGFNHSKKEWIYNDPSQEKYGPLRQVKCNPDLWWVLLKMYEHYLTFNSRVSLRLSMFKQRFCYIEIINFNHSLWKVYLASTGLSLVTLMMTS